MFLYARVLPSVLACEERRYPLLCLNELDDVNGPVVRHCAAGRLQDTRHLVVLHVMKQDIKQDEIEFLSRLKLGSFLRGKASPRIEPLGCLDVERVQIQPLILTMAKVLGIGSGSAANVQYSPNVFHIDARGDGTHLSRCERRLPEPVDG